MTKIYKSRYLAQKLLAIKKKVMTCLRADRPLAAGAVERVRRNNKRRAKGKIEAIESTALTNSFPFSDLINFDYEEV